MPPIVLLLVIAVYLAAVIGAGWWISRRAQGSADFFRGGRKSPWWAVAVAMVSTSISGITFVSVPGMVAASQWSYLQMALGFVAGYAVIAYVLFGLIYIILSALCGIIILVEVLGRFLNLFLL